MRSHLKYPSTRAEFVEQARFWQREWLRSRAEGGFYPSEYREYRDVCMQNARLCDQ